MSNVLRFFLNPKIQITYSIVDLSGNYLALLFRLPIYHTLQKKKEKSKREKDPPINQIKKSIRNPR